MIFKKVIKGGMCVQAGLRNANYYNTNEKGCESKDFFFSILSCSLLKIRTRFLTHGYLFNI